ncbi:hypothetical protein ABGN05_20060 [Aquibium sp. LZ166]|uniref:Peptidase M41 domain-containing protein n=1 Tax=Aquibium pacificus TaxID=3153579 RepID=A0ABV3SMF7_9HYPH
MTDYPLPPITDEMWPAVAHHEAGHAVAKIVGGRVLFGEGHFTSVGIRPGAGGLHTDRGGNSLDLLGFVAGPAFFNLHGLTAPIKFPDDRFRLHLRTCAVWEIIDSLAGPFAEAAFLGDRDPWVMSASAFDLRGWDSSDYNIAESAYASLRHLTPRRPRWGTLYYRTAGLVLNNWTAIEALAVRLLNKHELEFDEVLEIVAPHLSPTSAATLPARLSQSA